MWRRRAAAREDREEAELHEQRFPRERIERLPDVDERQIEDVERRPDRSRRHGADAFGHTGERQQRQRDAQPRASQERGV